MKTHATILCLSFALLGCFQKEEPKQVEQIVELEPVSNPQLDAIAQQKLQTSLQSIKQGLVELTELNDPNIQQIYALIDSFYQRGSANQQELDAVQVMINQHRTALVQAGAQSVEQPQQSEIAKQLGQSYGRVSPQKSESIEERINRDVLKLVKLNDPNVGEVYRLIEDLKADGSLSNDDAQVIFKQIGKNYSAMHSSRVAQNLASN